MSRRGSIAGCLVACVVAAACSQSAAERSLCLNGAACDVARCAAPTEGRACDANQLRGAKLSLVEAAALAGGAARAAEGDFLLTNGEVSAVISSSRSAEGFDVAGGSLIDLFTHAATGLTDGNDALLRATQAVGTRADDLAIYIELKLIDEAPARVAVEARGYVAGDPTLKVLTVYELRPCDPGVRVRTEVLNTGTDPRVVYPTDALQWAAGTHVFTPAPNAGFVARADSDVLALPFLAAASATTSYAWAACDGSDLASTAPVGSRTFAGRQPQLLLPRDYRVFERLAVVSKSAALSVSGAADLALALHAGQGLKQITGRLSSPAGASVLIAESQTAAEQPWTQTAVAADGTFTAVVPDGRGYVVRVSQLGRVVASASIPSAAGASVDVGTLDVPALAPVTLTVRDATAAPLFGEAIFIPADDATRTATEGSLHGEGERCAPWLGPPGAADASCNRVHVTPAGSTVAIPAGHYFVYATHGPGWTLERQEVTLAAAPVALAFTLRPLSVIPPSTLSADLHVHGGPDDAATLRGLVAQGVEVAITSQDDAVQDLRPAAAALGLSQTVALLPGAESLSELPFLDVPGLPTRATSGQFGFWPLRPAPGEPRCGVLRDEGLEPGTIFSRMLGRYVGVHVVQLDHPWRDPEGPVAGGFPRAIGLDARFDLGAVDAPATNALFTRTPYAGMPANDAYHAQGVLTGVRGEELLAQRALWFYLLNQGVLRTGTASSASHDGRVGVARTIVQGGGTPAAFDADGFAQAIRAGQAFGSNGPMIEATVDRLGGPAAGYGVQQRLVPDLTGSLNVRVSAAPWIPVDELRVVVNGAVVQTVALPPPADPFGVADTLRFDGVFPLGDLLATVSGDAWIVVEAGRALPVAGDLGGGIGGMPDGIPDTTDNDGNGFVDAADVAGGAAVGPILPRPPPATPTDPLFHYAQVTGGADPYAFTNPFVLDVDGNGVFEPPGVGGGFGP